MIKEFDRVVLMISIPERKLFRRNTISSLRSTGFKNLRIVLLTPGPYDWAKAQILLASKSIPISNRDGN